MSLCNLWSQFPIYMMINYCIASMIDLREKNRARAHTHLHTIIYNFFMMCYRTHANAPNTHARTHAQREKERLTCQQLTKLNNFTLNALPKPNNNLRLFHCIRTKRNAFIRTLNTHTNQQTHT